MTRALEQLADELAHVLREVVRISDRKHDAWDAAKVALARHEAEFSTRPVLCPKSTRWEWSAIYPDSTRGARVLCLRPPRGIKAAPVLMYADPRSRLSLALALTWARRSMASRGFAI